MVELGFNCKSVVIKNPCATDSLLLYANCKLLFYPSNKGHGNEVLLSMYSYLADQRRIRFYGFKGF